MREKPIDQPLGNIRLSAAPQASVEGNPLILLRGEHFGQTTKDLAGFDPSSGGPRSSTQSIGQPR
jgi:hypothetical protein